MEDFTFPMQIVHSPRRKKTCHIEIKNKKIIVSVPQNYSQKKIDLLIKKYCEWIKKTIKKQEKIIIPQAKKYEDGEMFTFLGKKYRLKIVFHEPHSQDDCSQTDAYLKVAIGKNECEKDQKKMIQQAVENWYKTSAEKILREKTQKFGEMLGVKATAIKIKNYKSRWGSCNLAKEITYNWRIIMAPERVVDYLVVHELCHILQHNHSPAYWQLVKKIIPDFKKDNEWLKKNGLTLEI